MTFWHANAKAESSARTNAVRHALLAGAFFLSQTILFGKRDRTAPFSTVQSYLGKQLLRLGVKCAGVKALVAEKKHTSAHIAPLKQALQKAKICLSKHKACALLNRLNTHR